VFEIEVFSGVESDKDAFRGVLSEREAFNFGAA
jgi:hypothetical protein